MILKAQAVVTDWQQEEECAMQISSSMLTATLLSQVAQPTSLSIWPLVALAMGLTGAAALVAISIAVRSRRRMVPVKVRKQ